MGTSTNNVCSPAGDERQTECLPGLSPRCVCSPSDFTEGGVLRTNIAKLSAFSGEMAKGEVSFEQWSYEFQMLHKSYCNSAPREGIQHSLREAAADLMSH